MSSECVIHFVGFGFFVGAAVVIVVFTGVMEEQEDAEQEDDEESRRLRLGGSCLVTLLTLLVTGVEEEVGGRAGVMVVDEDCFLMLKGIVNNLSFGSDSDKRYSLFRMLIRREVNGAGQGK